MYATAAVGALLLAAGACRVLRGSGSLDPPAAGRRGLSSTEQLNFARQHFGLRFGGHFEVYDVPIIPGYGDPDAAALAVLMTTTPRSIAENTEYGGFVYRDTDRFFDFTPPLGGTVDAVDLDYARLLIPPGAKVVGVYHTHADFAVRIGGNVYRAFGPVDPIGSMFFSHQDLRLFHLYGEVYPFFRGYLGTPAGTFKTYDPHRSLEYMLL